jgi:hypothetical protein
MSETTAQYLSRLHSSTAIAAEAEVVERRATAIESIASQMTTEQAISGAAVAAGVASDLSRLQWLIQPVSEADPSFSPVTVDKAVAALSSALTFHVLTRSDSRSVAAALALLSAGMSKANGAGIDGRLPSIAQQRIWAMQRTPTPSVKYAAPAQTVTAEQIAAFHTPLSQNSVPGSAEPLKVIVETLAKADAAQGKATADAIGALIARQAILEEETQMQWWVIGKASYDLLRPFADIAPFEAAARAAKELASMISPQRLAGPFAAPALLERVLESNSKSRLAAQPFERAMTGIPREARAEIFLKKPSAAVAPAVFPIMLGAEYSIESVDAPDWQPRFARNAHVDATVELTPVEFAKQLLRELLLWKLLPA